MTHGVYTALFSFLLATVLLFSLKLGVDLWIHVLTSLFLCLLCVMHISSIWEQNIVKDVSLLNSLKVTLRLVFLFVHS